MNAIELIREFLRDRLGVAVERVVPEAALESLGVDSLMMLELVFEFEDRFGIKLPSGVKTPRTVGEMSALMETLAAGRPG